MMKRDEQTYAIIGAAIDVHKYMGNGFWEAVYQDCLEKEFIQRNIPYQREVAIPIYYKGEPIKSFYRADFVCYGTVIVELKALSAMSGTEESQVLNYLKATGMHKALLLNFGTPILGKFRYVR